MGETILITSGKGGCGKSSLTVNCGAMLASLGKKVLLVDADAGLRALDLMLSVSGRVVYDLSDVLAGRCETVRAIIETDIPGLHLLPAPSDDEIPEPLGMQQLCKGLSHYYDYVFIDSPAGIGAGVLTVAAAADRVIVVATADPVAVRDADRIASALLGLGITDIRLVLNRVVPKLIRKKVAYDLDRAIDGAAVQLLGVVPEDENVTASVYNGKPLSPSRKGAAAAFENIARRITGEEVPLIKL